MNKGGRYKRAWWNIPAPTVNIDGGTIDGLTSLGIRSTGAAYDLKVASSAVYTANRTLTINIPTTASAALTLTGDLIRSGAHSLTFTTTAATDVTLPTTGTLATLAGTEEFTNKTLNASVGKGTWTASGTWVLPAFQLSAAAGIGRAVDTNFLNLIGGTDDHSARLILWGKSSGSPGAFQFQTPNAALLGTTRLLITGAADTVSATWSSLYHIGMKFGLAGTATGAWTMDGATSGVVTMTVAAAAGTWTMTLPTGAGTANYFLQTDGAGVTSWSNTITAPALNGTVTTTGLTMPTFTLGGNLTIADAINIILNATTGTKIGTATTQKLGFYNATPVVQGASVADATGGATIDAEARTAINALISRIEALGLIATV